MDFSKALEALKDNKKVTRKSSRALGNGRYWVEFVNVVGDGISDAESFFIINEIVKHCQFLPSSSDLLAKDWEIVPDAPELSPEEVLSEFRTWLETEIHHTNRTPGNAHPYLIQCMEKLNELSSSTTTVKTPGISTVVSIIGNQVMAEDSGEYVIVQLQGVKL